MKLKLIRDEESENATIGRLFADDHFLAFTLENEWKDNEQRKSCIPDGTYEVYTKTYGRYYKSFGRPIPILRDVPNRSEILIHWGNYPKDTLGCILVGDSKGEEAVWNSKKTYRKIYPYLAQSTEITIEYANEDNTKNLDRKDD